MKYLSVCSGIEAATVAWHHMGWKPLAFSEIEKFPRALLSHHYPDVALHGDFTKLRDQEWIGEADLLVGGTPCQAFSVAGLRQSLSDDRGNLSLEFVRLADAIDNLRPAGRGAIIVWENVPGVLSVKDNAFGCFLAAIVGNDNPLVPTGGKWTNAGLVIGPKRTAAWRVLDAQYFGVAQRRRRVFVVASSRDGFDPAEVLFEREGLCRDTAPRREKGQESSPALRTRPPGFSGQGSDCEQIIAHTLTAHTGIKSPDMETYLPTVFHPTQDPISSTDGSTHALGCGSSQGQATVAVAYAIQGSMIGRNDKAGPQGYGVNEEICFTQNTIDQHAVSINMAVRRLTPMECERLQGFPDGWTEVPGSSDSSRYKALGNSMAVPVMRWIGERINAKVKGDSK